MKQYRGTRALVGTAAMIFATNISVLYIITTY